MILFKKRISKATLLFANPRRHARIEAHIICIPEVICFLTMYQLWIYDLGMAEWVERLLVSIHLCCTIQTSSSLWTRQPFASSKYMYSAGYSGFLIKVHDK